MQSLPADRRKVQKEYRHTESIICVGYVCFILQHGVQTVGRQLFIIPTEGWDGLQDVNFRPPSQNQILILTKTLAEGYKPGTAAGTRASTIFSAGKAGVFPNTPAGLTGAFTVAVAVAVTVAEIPTKSELAETWNKLAHKILTSRE